MRKLVLAGIVSAVATLIGANAHLVYVALASQPDCVAHEEPGKLMPGVYSAAKSAC